MRILFLPGLAFLFSCSGQQPEQAKISSAVVPLLMEESISGEKEPGEFTDPGDETAIYYTVTAGSGRDYPSMRKAALEIAAVLRIPFDSLGRRHHPEKGIVLPDECDDELYCGEYYPRRPFYDEQFVSIEQLAVFSGSSGHAPHSPLEMVIVTGMFEDREEAEDQAGLMARSGIKAGIIVQDVYMGCMH